MQHLDADTRHAIETLRQDAHAGDVLVRPGGVATVRPLVARYLASLPGEMQTVPQEKFISRTAAAK